MVITRPVGIDAGFPNASDHRKGFGGILAREGVLPSPITTDLNNGIAYAGSGWNIAARSFGAALRRGTTAYSLAYGSVPLANDATLTTAWTMTAAPGTGSRIDLLWIRARDTSQGDSTSGAPTDGPSGATRTGFPEWGITTGTAGTDPVAPALPAGALEIAQVRSTAGQSSAAQATITNTYLFGCLVGGTQYVRNAVQLTAGGGIVTSPIEGEEVHVLDTGERYKRTNGTWAFIGRVPVDFAPPVFGNGFTAYAASGWSGVRIESEGRMIKVNGATILNPSPQTAQPAGTAMFNVPAGFRPKRQVRGVNCYIGTDGDVRNIAVVAPGEAVSLDLSYFI